ncbi:hypothetical protein CXB51_032093 [Gossypium anomalum]|uniref:ADP-ribosylation factor-like protein 2 n=1 Tax=Gossypium anomalum TaxID=47600 RepID=A0A8J5XS04_9ROSI|nr:hypothetical protein CXB51_032093 [Gossypium anomalum]
MQQAEDYFDSVMETAVDEFSCYEISSEDDDHLFDLDYNPYTRKRPLSSRLDRDDYDETDEEEANRQKLYLVPYSGLDNSGKTTIVLKINGEDTSLISPTLGFNIKTITYQKYTLNIWDVGGQRTIRSYWRNYFEQTDCLVWVVDSSDLRRLDDCKMELDNLLKEERLSEASLLIQANIKGALTQAEIAKVVTRFICQSGNESDHLVLHPLDIEGAAEDSIPSSWKSQGLTLLQVERYLMLHSLVIHLSRNLNFVL